MKKHHKKIFAVVGMAGSGKTEAIEYLKRKFHWPKVYFPESLFNEIEKRGLELNWDNERKMREGLRGEHGQGVFAKLSLPKIQKMFKQSDVVLVESLYSWDEYKIIKRSYPDYFEVIAVYASPAVRFERLQNRKIRPIKTFKEFQERDESEIKVTGKGGPIAIADHTIINHGSINNLYSEVDKIMVEEGITESPRASDDQ
ncbi:MAG: AAA family ATPase [Patescibacteria group bacterium]|nr:AAA family ATPase [Patescibacteria group bacterium]